MAMQCIRAAVLSKTKAMQYKIGVKQYKTSPMQYKTTTVLACTARVSFINSSI